jgi:8-oxo-dGTP diphosphatase
MAAYGVSVLIVKDGLILSVPRRNNPNDFGLPGGKVEEGESEVDAAARELFDETGLVAFNLVEVFRSNVVESGEEACTYTCAYTGKITSQPGEPECSWQTPEVIIRGTFGEYNKNLFKKVGII